MSSPLDSLLQIMARLRDPEHGCPWDRAQTFATIAPYTLEEAYEVADAIEKGDSARLKDELGDLLFQVVFHARMAEERGWFGFPEVAEAICEKLIRRHPHVFTDPRPATDPTTLSMQWEAQKERERSAAALRSGAPPPSLLADVPLALPALVRAGKLGRRAARVGFDWPSAGEVREKVIEEMGEIDAAVAEAAAAHGAARPEQDSKQRVRAFEELGDPRVFEELGDLLFAIVNWSRHLNVDPEAALRAANLKFERRFSSMEQKARERGLALSTLSAAQWDRLWRECKGEQASRD